MPSAKHKNSIKILVDTHEAKLLPKLSSIIDDASEYHIESVRLDIGDIHILQYPPKTTIENMLASGSVAPIRKLVIERKTVADMISSVKDGRYREQKKRLSAWETRARANGKQRRVCYVIEGHLEPSKHDGAARRLYWGSQISTVLRDSVPIFNTSGVEQTAELIMRLAHRLADTKTCSDLFIPISATTDIPVINSSMDNSNASNASNASNDTKPIIFTGKLAGHNNANNTSNGNNVSNANNTSNDGNDISNNDNGDNGDTDDASNDNNVGRSKKTTSTRRRGKQLITSKATTNEDGVKIIEFEGVNGRDVGVDNGIRGVSPSIPCDETGIRRVKISISSRSRKTIDACDSYDMSKTHVHTKPKQPIKSKPKNADDSHVIEGEDDVVDLNTTMRLSYLDTIIKKKKSSNITPANCHVIMLGQIPGISAKSASAIMVEFNNDISSLFSYLADAAKVDITVPSKKDKKTGKPIEPTPEQVKKAERKAHANALQRLADIIVNSDDNTSGSTNDSGNDNTSGKNKDSENKDGESSDNKPKGRRLGSVLAIRLMEYLVNK